MEDIVRCEKCGRTVLRKDTLIRFDRGRNRKIRLCRDCQLGFFIKELKDSKQLSLDAKLEIMDLGKGIKNNGIDNRE